MSLERLPPSQWSDEERTKELHQWLLNNTNHILHVLEDKHQAEIEDYFNTPTSSENTETALILQREQREKEMRVSHAYINNTIKIVYMEWCEYINALEISYRQHRDNSPNLLENPYAHNLQPDSGQPLSTDELMEVFLQLQSSENSASTTASTEDISFDERPSEEQPLSVSPSRLVVLPSTLFSRKPSPTNQEAQKPPEEPKHRQKRKRKK